MLVKSVRNAAVGMCAVGVVILNAGCDKLGGAPGANAKLETDQQKASYFIGTRIGMQMSQAMGNGASELDQNAVSAGIADMLAQKEPRVKPEDMQAAMGKFQEAVMKKQNSANEELKKKGVEFLEKNKSKAGVKTTASGLQYEIVQEGTGAAPKPTDTVSVHYTGTFVDGKKFDSSAGGQPAQFQVNQVIPGWTEGLQLMKVGGKYKFAIPSNLAYGPEGRMPAIPPDSVLLFDVELLNAAAAPAAPTAPAADDKKGKKN
ncbi:MAG: FKBP-type peptidyl-prolyl cis-trans isomerase [Bdellovibrionaceae bacterium]|nr:FKBP-type peptidyl-prolyl cis-trans isomerase [Pseudobdellovibrionaceae bacterium]